MTYAGDISPKDAWELMRQEPAARLVDVRTRPEWMFVGIPELSGLGRSPILLAWQEFPAMQVNARFVEELAKALPDKEAPICFLCRSGARSKSAAIAMTAAGYKRCYNIKDGFEGAPDGERHRGRATGWKAAGLPWIQE